MCNISPGRLLSVKYLFHLFAFFLPLDSFNQLDLPPYETYDKLHHMLLTASRECPEGFGFA